MKARSILIISLGLNLILAGWVAARLRDRTAVSVPPVGEVEGPARPRARLRMERTNVIEVTTNVVDAPGFRWAQIETNDFHAYVANLRAVGCPERTVQHLLIAEVDELYRELAEDEPPHSFWETASQQASRQRQLERRRLALRQEQRALLRELVGVTYSPKVFETWLKEIEGAVILGFISDDKALQVIDAIEEAEGGGSAIRAEARGILIAEDEEKIRKVVAQTQRALASSLSPFEYDEVKLRLMGLVQYHGSADDGLIGIDLTGAELRALAQLSSSGQDGLEKLIRMIVGGSDMPDIRQDPPEAFEAEARQLLGDRRYLDYLRSGDGKFREAFQIAKRQNLSPAAAETVYEVHRAAEEQIKRLGADDSLSAERRRVALGEVRAATEQAIRQALGEEGSRRYLERQRIQMPAERSDRRP